MLRKRVRFPPPAIDAATLQSYVGSTRRTRPEISITLKDRQTILQDRLDNHPFS